jgi:hypothetical protein
MSTHNQLVHPKVPKRRPSVPTETARRFVGPSQRDLVLASLVRCPEGRLSATGRKAG